MVTPERDQITWRRLRPVFAFFIGAMLGGLSTAGVLWVAGAPVRGLLPRWGGLLLLAAHAVMCVLLEFGILPDRWKLGTRRQVPEEVFLRYGLVRGSLQFGFEMGTGVRTYLPSAVPLVPAAALLVGGLAVTAALAAGVGFGAGRGLMPALRALARDRASWDGAVSRAAGAGLYAHAALGVMLPALILSLVE